MQIHFIDQKGNLLDVKPQKRSDVYTWNGDNAYPSLINQLVESSVTASASLRKVRKALYGKGFTDGNMVVNKKGQTLNQVLRIASSELIKHGNVFINVCYNGKFKANQIYIIPCEHVRVGLSDDWGYSGKFVVYDNWDKSQGKISYDDFQVIDRYNSQPNVIESQIKKQGSLLKYKGQILHIMQEETHEIYGKSALKPAIKDMVLEDSSATFRMNGSKKGFLNNKMIIVKKFTDDTARERFTQNIKKMQGAEGTGHVFVFETDGLTEDLEGSLKLQDITSDFNDKIFQYSDEKALKSISTTMGCYTVLIDTSDNSVFGNGSETLLNAKKMLFNDMEEERDILEENFNMIFSKWHEQVSEKKIINPYEEKNLTPTTEDE